MVPAALVKAKVPNCLAIGIGTVYENLPDCWCWRCLKVWENLYWNVIGVEVSPKNAED